MLFSRGMCGRHLFKLLLHPLKDKARPRQPRHVAVVLVLLLVIYTKVAKRRQRLAALTDRL
jgi:hypothetical protein